MKNHLLLAKAYIYPTNRINPQIDDCNFDGEAGFWVINDTGTPFVKDNNRPKPMTKKADVETGEDRK
ncbi:MULTISPECIES: hypothetical protein [unclassified Paenibacillus]|uniref:hypothetical protein n=1 Tax=unclassified Paenibacillus TaxID=185978 RepID=UPI001AE392DF|nr:MULTISPECIES: hypothetical protein [unclassified Paenibacillus]MBP1154644.1 hypothetical protein [Paenibacillus sp. PvP091]MBP1169972.1 hypothetical protein [Paenibacillus sp. PvR098]MBP2441000.1 hypothetical protein [Paenibacillus sp. PvP052]